MALDPEVLVAVPKVSLHDHLDGGLRPATVAELAVEVDHPLPTTNPDALGAWFRESADSGSLVRYLETFDHTVAVMQTRDNLVRVAGEFVEDLAADGVVYGEARWAPEQHTRGGLSRAEAVAAVRDGLADGMARCRAAGREIVVRQLLTSMRHVEPTTETAELTVAFRGAGVAGFDIAGAEDGFPPERWLPAFAVVRQASMPYTIHAGEAAGLSSIWAALQLCSANRIGHGVRITEGIAEGPGGEVGLGELAAYVLDQRVPLEMCPSSNVQTGAVSSLEEHPVRRLDELGFRVTVNCDNQLMSGTRLSREFGLLGDVFDYGLDDVRRLTVNAAKSAFWPYADRRALLEDVIEPGFRRFG